MIFLKQWRRNRVRKRIFPAEWLRIVERNVPYFGRLTEEDRKELLGHVLVFLAEKHFEGCGGQELTDGIRVTIAAQACVLLLHRETDYFPKVESILVYPHPYVARRVERDPDGLVHEQAEVREGESWDRGTVVLSWDEVSRDASGLGQGRNIVLHEFAHQLDQESGKADGAPLLPHRSMYADWAKVMEREYRKLKRDLKYHQRTLIDPYGATDPAEFFAVVTECFFEDPLEMRGRHPELYEQMRLFYRQDPAALAERRVQPEPG